MGEKEQSTTAEGERKSGSIIAADEGAPGDRARNSAHATEKAGADEDATGPGQAGIAVTDEGVGPAKPAKPTK